MEIGKVSSLAFGGNGIVRQENLVVFIPFTLVGETIRYRIVQRKKNFAVGELVEVLEASPARVTPLCPYFGSCGGCQLQQMNYSAQLEAKRQWIEDALKRQAGLADVVVPPVIASQLQWNYRRRVSLVLKPFEERFKVGYIATDNTTLLEVKQCPIFIPKEDPILLLLAKTAASLIAEDDTEGKVTILKHPEKGYLWHFSFKVMPRNADQVFKDALKANPQILGILASSRGKTIQLGTQEVIIEIEGLTFEVTPKAFIQNHPEQSLNIYNTIRASAKRLNPQAILDLYCGIGVSSLLLAKEGFSVLGIEANQEAIQLAKANAQRNHLSKERFKQGLVEQDLPQLLQQEKPSLVIVNPPREGMHADAIAALKNYPVQHLFYISCMPSTLARDIKALSPIYHLTAVQGYDMFPQTTHVETLVQFSC